MNDKNNVIERLSDILKDRKESSDSSSYTSMLYSEGIQKIISKIKEESNELIEAALDDVKKDDAGKPVKQSKNDEAWHWEYTKPGILTT